jgi:DNA-binding MarR family transcriptional regulator
MAKQDILNLPIQFENKAHEALMNVWWTGLALKKAANSFFQDDVASDAQFNILVLLHDAQAPMTQNDLSKKLLVDKSNITGLVDRLEKQGLIKRTEVQNDRRSYHIKLTKQGADVIKKLNASYLERVEKIMGAFNKKDQDELIAMMKRVRQGIMDSQSE